MPSQLLPDPAPVSADAPPSKAPRKRFEDVWVFLFAPFFAAAYYTAVTLLKRVGRGHV